MNIIKKIIVIILSLVVVTGIFVPTAGVLAATFNNDAQDHPTLRVSNYTRNPGGNINWSGSVSANAGEVLSFIVYYHNTDSDIANGTTVRVQLPSGTFTSTTVTGEVRASNAATVNSSVSVNLTSGQSMSFIPGSVSWYPDGSATSRALLNGQNGSEIVSNGLFVGDISGGWSTQGYVIFRAQITNNGVIGTSGSAPIVTTNSVFSVTQASAVGHGVVNPNNLITTAWFEYGTTQSLGSITGYQNAGIGNDSINITGYFHALAPNTTYYYRAVAQNVHGTTYGTTMSFMTQSTDYGSNDSTPFVYTSGASSVAVNSAVFNGSVNPNNRNTNAWFEYGTTQSLGYTAGYQAVGSGNHASTLTSAVYNLAPNTTYYYRAVAQNAYGTTYGTTMSVTTGGTSVNSYGNTPYVTTYAAQSVFRNSALINGNVNPNRSLTTSWFDWGATTGFGSRTIIMPVGQASYTSSYSAVLSGLQANTTYYYRAVAQNAYGTTYGNTLSLTTEGAAIIPVAVTGTASVAPRVIVVQQPSESGSVVALLTPSIDKKNPNAGDTVEYSIQYRNESNSPITGATLKIDLPSEVTFESASLRASTSTDGMAIFDLGTIAGNTQGVITIKATIDRSVDADDALIFGATMTYVNAQKQFQSTTAYLTVVVGSGVAGLASLLSVLGDLFTNWFVDLILGLLIGFGIYHFFVRQKEEEVIIK